jgi:hypothetical protein
VKVLFDQGVPAPLRGALPAHTVSTAFEMGWSELANGALLKAADAQFDVLITTDRNFSYQQNLSGLRLAVLVLPTTNWPTLRQHQDRIAVAVEQLQPGRISLLTWT